MAENALAVTEQPSLEELKSRSKLHWESCTECTKVAGETDIQCNEEQFRQARKHPVALGQFSMPGWSGHSWFYLTRCAFGDCPRHRESSEGFFVDYPHGYTAGGRLYLRCPSCRGIEVLKHAEVYWAAGMPSPPTAWQVFTDTLRMLKGKRPIHDGLPAPKDWRPPTLPSGPR